MLQTVGISVSGAALFATMRRELDDIIARQKKAAEKQISLAGAFRGAKLAIGADVTPKQAADLERSIQQISQETGLLPRDVAIAAQSALSARGQLPVSTALQAIREAARVTPEQPENLATFASGILDIMKLSDGRITDPRQAAGFLPAAFSTSRVTNMADLARNIVPAVTSLAQFGDSLEQSTALVNAIGQATGDPTGERSRTASISLAQQLEQFFADNRRLANLGTTSTTERLRMLQGDDRLRAQFLEKASFEKFAAKPIEGLLTKGSEVAAIFDNALANAPNIDQAAQTFERLVKVLGTGDTETIAEFKRRAGSAVERGFISDVPGGLRAAIRAEMLSGLEAAGLGHFNRSMAAHGFDVQTGLFGQEPAAVALDKLRAEVSIRERAGITEAEQRQIDTLNELIQVLSRLADQGGRQEVRVRDDRVDVGRSAPTPLPAAARQDRRR